MHNRLFSHMFFPLEIDTFYLGDQDGISSIMVCTLIHLLCQSLYPCAGVPTPLANIIFSVERCTNIMVATSKVPKFGQEYQNPVYGYTALGVLSQFPPSLEQPAAVFQHRQEITALHDAGHPTTSQFKRNWTSGMQLNLTKHFLIIFVQPALCCLHSSHSVLRNWPNLSKSHQSPTLTELSKPHYNNTPAQVFRNSTSDFTPSPEPNGFTSEYSSSSSPLYTFDSSALLPQEYLNTQHSTFNSSAPLHIPPLIYQLACLSLNPCQVQMYH